MRSHAPAPARPGLRAVRALDDEVQALRAEARTGLGTQEVRRTLIREQLRRPPAPPSRTPHGSSSVGTGPATTSPTSRGGAGAGKESDATADIPVAWLVGDFSLEPAPATAVASPPLTTGPTPTSSSSGDDACLRAYTALRTAAAEIDYDVAHEDALRRVETRDEATGLAMAWRTQRQRCSSAPASLLLLPWSAAAAPVDRGTASRSTTTAAITGARPDLYKVPPSRTSAAGSNRGSGGRLAPALPVPRPASQDSTTSEASRASTHGGAGAKPRPPPATPSVGNGGGAAASASLSSAGSAVAHSSAASYATTLRQLVQAQRQQSSIDHRSSSTGAASRGEGARRLEALTHDAYGASGGGGGAGGMGEVGDDSVDADRGGVVEWRTRLTAAVTLAVCPSCHAWFKRPLQQRCGTPPPSHFDGAGDGETAASGGGCYCPRCGCDVDAAPPDADGSGVAAAEGAPRWVWASPIPTPAHRRTSHNAPTSAGDGAPMREDAPASMVPPAGSRHLAGLATASAAAGETCGTDSVGFAEDGAESFAALVARIRASRLEDHRPSPVTRVAAAAAATTSSSSSSSTGAAAAARESWAGAATLAAAAAPATPLAQSLRKALSHLYFHDLLASVCATRP